jgi:hypothetical protein
MRCRHQRTDVQPEVLGGCGETAGFSDCLEALQDCTRGSGLSSIVQGHILLACRKWQSSSSSSSRHMC